MRPLAKDDRAVFGALDREECLLLVRWESVGRLAVARHGFAPVVVPVNFVLDGDTILFRTDVGDTTLRLFENPASFQVDRFDWYRRIGWSVLIQGNAQLLTPEEADALDTDVVPWAPGERDLVVRIVPESISGRRVELVSAVVDPRGYR
jgi:nitroimidazol reductase NimA-like FMN-containing flavoprotein (pyridoxamine 5'-phosphate oxidase superfamily)